MAATGDLWWTTPLQCLATIGMAANCGKSTIDPCTPHTTTAEN